MAATKASDAPSAVARGRQLVERHPPLFVGGLLLLLGVGLLAFVAKVLDLSAGSILVIAFLGPLLAYLVMTGQLSEIGGAGFSAKFREAARQPVANSARRITVEATQTIPKLGVDEFARFARLDREAPVVLTLTLGAPGDSYMPNALRHYVNVLARYPRFRFVVLLDPQGRAVAYLPRETVAFDLETDAAVRPLLDAVNSGHLPGIEGLRTEFLAPQATVEDALQRMADLRLDAMLVRDTEGTLVGVVEREDVLADFLLAAARS